MINKNRKRKKEPQRPPDSRVNSRPPKTLLTKLLGFLQSGQGGGIGAGFGITHILIAEQLGGLSIGGIVLWAADKTRSTESPASHSGLGFALFALALGLAMAVWIIDGIWRPRVKVGTLSKLGWTPDYEYCSTHPSYVLIDCLILPLWLPELANHPVGLSFNPLVAGACAFFVFIAVARLAMWYGFNRRISPDESRRAWQPVAMFLGIVALFLGSIGVVNWIRSRHG